jgi:hypothetical protein
MAIELIDNPLGIGTDDKDRLGGDSSFPDAVIVIELGGGRYGAVNASTPAPDVMTVGLIACFATEKEAEIWEEKYFSGNKVSKTFEEAREIATSKPNIYGLALQRNANTAAIHWVR